MTTTDTYCAGTVPATLALEVTMLKPTSYTVVCPGTVCQSTGTCGELVTAHYGTAAAKTVRVDPCSKLIAQGWRGHQLALRKADAASQLQWA
jgi:hypothetical protein